VSAFDIEEFPSTLVGRGGQLLQKKRKIREKGHLRGT